MKSSRRWEFTQGMAKSVHFVSTVSTLALKVDGTIMAGQWIIMDPVPVHSS